MPCWPSSRGIFVNWTVALAGEDDSVRRRTVCATDLSAVFSATLRVVVPLCSLAGDDGGDAVARHASIAHRNARLGLNSALVMGRRVSGDVSCQANQYTILRRS